MEVQNTLSDESDLGLIRPSFVQRKQSSDSSEGSIIRPTETTSSMAIKQQNFKNTSAATCEPKFFRRTSSSCSLADVPPAPDEAPRNLVPYNTTSTSFSRSNLDGCQSQETCSKSKHRRQKRSISSRTSSTSVVDQTKPVSSFRKKGALPKHSSSRSSRHSRKPSSLLPRKSQLHQVDPSSDESSTTEESSGGESSTTEESSVEESSTKKTSSKTVVSRQKATANQSKKSVAKRREKSAHIKTKKKQSPSSSDRTSDRSSSPSRNQREKRSYAPLKKSNKGDKKREKGVQKKHHGHKQDSRRESSSCSSSGRQQDRRKGRDSKIVIERRVVSTINEDSDDVASSFDSPPHEPRSQKRTDHSKLHQTDRSHSAMSVRKDARSNRPHSRKISPEKRRKEKPKNNVKRHPISLSASSRSASSDISPIQQISSSRVPKRTSRSPEVTKDTSRRYNTDQQRSSRALKASLYKQQSSSSSKPIVSDYTKYTSQKISEPGERRCLQSTTASDEFGSRRYNGFMRAPYRDLEEIYLRLENQGNARMKEFADSIDSPIFEECIPPLDWSGDVLHRLEKGKVEVNFSGDKKARRPYPVQRFEDLSCSQEVLSALKKVVKQKVSRVNGIDMSDIQQFCIPTALQGFDVWGVSSTGTGKTLSYMIPAAEAVFRAKKKGKRGPHVLILGPTIDLVSQIRASFKDYFNNDQIIIPNVHDKNIRSQLRPPPDIIISTVSKVLDLADPNPGAMCNLLGLDKVKLVVLDEVDKLLQQNPHHVLCLLSNAAIPHQTIFMTATLPLTVQKICRDITRPSYLVEIFEGHQPVTMASNIIHSIAYIDREEERQECLHRILQKKNTSFPTIVFCNTVNDVKSVAESLKNAKFNNVFVNHSQLDKAERNAVQVRFQRSHKNGDIFVATDTLARGVHNEYVDLVIHYKPPDQASWEKCDYTHRVGRCARNRFGTSAIEGEAVTIVRGERERYQFGCNLIQTLKAADLERRIPSNLADIQSEMAQSDDSSSS